MNKKNSRCQPSKPIPPLPPTFTTKNGKTINTSQAAWEDRANGTEGKVSRINWNVIPSHMDDELILTSKALTIFKLCIIEKFQQRQPGTAAVDFNSIKHFLEWAATNTAIYPFTIPIPFSWADLTEPIFRAYTQYCNDNLKTMGNNANTLRRLYKWGMVRGYSDFDYLTHLALDTIKLQRPKTNKTVLSEDPKKGPLTGEELETLMVPLRAGFGPPTTRATLMLFIETGMRPASATLLKNKDLIVTGSPDYGYYDLDIPVSKQSSSDIQHIRFPISRHLGELLQEVKAGSDGDRMLHWINDKIQLATSGHCFNLGPKHTT